MDIQLHLSGLRAISDYQKEDTKLTADALSSDCGRDVATVSVVTGTKHVSFVDCGLLSYINDWVFRMLRSMRNVTTVQGVRFRPRYLRRCRQSISKTP